MTFTIANTDLFKPTSYVDGQWMSTGKKTFSVTNPSNGEELAVVDDADEALVTKAVEAAHAALKPWQKLTANTRSKLLRTWYNLLLEHQEDLAAIMTLEQGKPLRESRGEIVYGGSFIEWFAEEGKRAYGEITPPPLQDRKILTIKQPVGVVGAITPWNFPNGMIARKAAPALAVGCTIVIKPATLTPLSALAMAELASRAGIPKGVINVVVSTDARNTGKILTTHPLVSKFTFTGSTEVGKILMSQCVSTVKKVSMELGGNAPFIVFDDAQLNKAVKGLLVAKFRNAGQTCVCANRVFVQRGVYKKFVEMMVAAVSALKVGDGFDEEVEIGPLVSQQAVADVHALVEKAVAEGGKLELGGTLSEHGSCFYSPTVISNVSSTMELSCKEQFGPVLALIPFDTEEEVIALANNTPYGLAAYFYTENYHRQWRVSEALESGLVGINEGLISNVAAPFGGYKESGTGKEGSRHGLDDYLEMKYICVGGVEPE